MCCLLIKQLMPSPCICVAKQDVSSLGQVGTSSDVPLISYFGKLTFC